MSDALEAQIKQVAADVFGVPLASVTLGMSPASVANWDSVQQLNFVLAIEQATGIQLEPEEMEAMRSVGAAIEIVRKKRR